MATQYLLNFLIRSHADAIEFEVRESDWLRAQNMFDHGASFYQPSGFLVFDAVDGLAVAVSLSDVQLVRFLSNPVVAPSDLKHKQESVRVWLRGREEPISVDPDAQEIDSLSGFFVLLDSGAEMTQFPGLIDVDGEPVLFNAAEVVLATAPLHEVSMGHRMLQRDDDSVETDGSKGFPF